MILRRHLMQLRSSLLAAGLVGAIAALGTTTLLGEQAPETGVTADAESTASKTLTDYFGATPPGENAEIFAPGLVSRPDRFEARIAFSTDMQECYLTETDATFSRPKILAAHRNKDGWTEFATAPFASKFKVCHEPFISDDNQKLYLTADGDEAVAGNRRDLWVTERTGSGWGEPSRLPAPINSEAAEFYFNQSSDGTIVFASNRPGGQGAVDLYQVEKSADGAAHAVNLGPVLNTPGPEYDPCISRDGRFIVFAAAREGRPNLDLYVSFRDNLKTWTTPVPLKGNVNTAANEYAPTLSRDGRYLFFVRHDGKQSDIFWMATTQFNPGSHLRNDK